MRNLLILLVILIVSCDKPDMMDPVVETAIEAVDVVETKSVSAKSASSSRVQPPIPTVVAELTQYIIDYANERHGYTPYYESIAPKGTPKVTDFIGFTHEQYAKGIVVLDGTDFVVFYYQLHHQYTWVYGGHYTSKTQAVNLVKTL